MTGNNQTKKRNKKCEKKIEITLKRKIKYTPLVESWVIPPKKTEGRVQFKDRPRRGPRGVNHLRKRVLGLEQGKQFHSWRAL